MTTIRRWIWITLLFFSPVYSAQVETSTLTYKGWEGALRIANESIELVVIPQTGRILHLSSTGGENLLMVNSSLAGQLPPEEEGDWLNYGGDWLWAVHQDHWGKMGGPRWPPLRVLDRAHWHSDVEVGEDERVTLRLRRDLGTPVYAQVERRIEMRPGKLAEVKIYQSVRRIQASPVPVVLWQISQVQGPDRIFLDSKPDAFHGQGYRRIDFEDTIGEVLETCGSTLVYTLKEGAEHKFGTSGQWIASKKGNQALLIWAEGGKQNGVLPDGGCSVTLYYNSGLGYTEIETQSEAVELAPGEVLENTVVYRLVDLEEGLTDCQVAEKLAGIPPPTELISFSPEVAHPENQIVVKIRNDQSGGLLHWGLNSPDGNWVVPAKDYWPAGSKLAKTGKAVESPLPPPENGYSKLIVGPFDHPNQPVTSLHAVVRWGDEWESNDGANYNLEIVAHADASQAQWVIPKDSLEAGNLNVRVGSLPAADELRLYLNGEEILVVLSDSLTSSLDATNWGYGPHDLKVRMMRDGHLSTDTKRIWKLPKLETVDPLPEGATYGATYEGNKQWLIHLFAPNARFMSLEWKRGDGEPQTRLMQKTTDGHWMLRLEAEEHEVFSYRYILNGEELFADPWSKDVVWKNPDGEESHLPEHAWTRIGKMPDSLGEWDAPDPKTWVIYELSLPDMAPPGSFLGFIETLDYIQDLGVNIIEPLPVTTFPGAESWGYNPAFHMAIEGAYGSPQDFYQVLQESRKRGLGFITDIVLNHIDASSPLIQMHGSPEENPFTMPFDQFNWGFPKLDQQNPHLKRYIKDTLEHWVEFWGVDGFRYDATQWVKWYGYNEWGASWMSYVVDQANPDVIQIAENLPSEPNMIRGTELDGEWDGHYRWRMRKVFTEGRFEEPEKMREILDPRNHAYENGFQRIPYIESHDEERFVRELLEKGYTTGEAFTRHHAAAAITLTVPGMPMLYAGQEWGEMTPKVVGLNPLQWQLKDKPARANLLEKFKELIALRVEHRALHHDKIEFLHLDGEQGTLAYIRPGIPESVVVAFNVSKEGALIRLDVDGEIVRELHQSTPPNDLTQLTLRPGQARVFVVRHPIEAR